MWTSNYAAYQGRLNSMRRGKWYGSWIARRNDRRQWFQVDFGTTAHLIKVGTQGRYDANQWIRSFILGYGMDGIHFRHYKEKGRTRVSICYSETASCEVIEKSEFLLVKQAGTYDLC